MEALAVRSTGVLVRREGLSPLPRHDLLPALPARPEAVRVPDESLASIGGLPRIFEGPQSNAGPTGSRRAMAIAAYRRHMTAPTREARKGLFIDAYL